MSSLFGSSPYLLKPDERVRFIEEEERAKVRVKRGTPNELKAWGTVQEADQQFKFEQIMKSLDEPTPKKPSKIEVLDTQKKGQYRVIESVSELVDYALASGVRSMEKLNLYLNNGQIFQIRRKIDDLHPAFLEQQSSVMKLLKEWTDILGKMIVHDQKQLESIQGELINNRQAFALVQEHTDIRRQILDIEISLRDFDVNEENDVEKLLYQTKRKTAYDLKDLMLQVEKKIAEEHPEASRYIVKMRSIEETRGKQIDALVSDIGSVFVDFGVKVPTVTTKLKEESIESISQDSPERKNRDLFEILRKVFDEYVRREAVFRQIQTERESQIEELRKHESWLTLSLNTQISSYRDYTIVLYRNLKRMWMTVSGTVDLASLRNSLLKSMEMRIHDLRQDPDELENLKIKSQKVERLNFMKNLEDVDILQMISEFNYRYTLMRTMQHTLFIVESEIVAVIQDVYNNLKFCSSIDTSPMDTLTGERLFMLGVDIKVYNEETHLGKLKSGTIRIGKTVDDRLKWSHYLASLFNPFKRSDMTEFPSSVWTERKQRERMEDEDLILINDFAKVMKKILNEAVSFVLMFKPEFEHSRVTKYNGLFYFDTDNGIRDRIQSLEDDARGIAGAYLDLDGDDILRSLQEFNYRLPDDSLVKVLELLIDTCDELSNVKRSKVSIYKDIHYKLVRFVTHLRPVLFSWASFLLKTEFLLGTVAHFKFERLKKQLSSLRTDVHTHLSSWNLMDKLLIKYKNIARANTNQLIEQEGGTGTIDIFGFDPAWRLTTRAPTRQERQFGIQHGTEFPGQSHEEIRRTERQVEEAALEIKKHVVKTQERAIEILFQPILELYPNTSLRESFDDRQLPLFIDNESSVRSAMGKSSTSNDKEDLFSDYNSYIVTSVAEMWSCVEYGKSPTYTGTDTMSYLKVLLEELARHLSAFYTRNKPSLVEAASSMLGTAESPFISLLDYRIKEYVDELELFDDRKIEQLPVPDSEKGGTEIAKRIDEIVASLSVVEREMIAWKQREDSNVSRFENVPLANKTLAQGFQHKPSLYLVHIQNLVRCFPNPLFIEYWANYNRTELAKYINTQKEELELKTPKSSPTKSSSYPGTPTPYKYIASPKKVSPSSSISSSKSSSPMDTETVLRSPVRPEYDDPKRLSPVIIGQKRLRNEIDALQKLDQELSRLEEKVSPERKTRRLDLSMSLSPESSPSSKEEK